MKTQSEIIDEIKIHGHTVLVIEGPCTIDWYSPNSSPEDEKMITGYLLEEGFLEEWYGKEAVQEHFE